MTIRCRLNKLLEEKSVTPKRLAEMTRLPMRRVMEYCDEEIDAVSLSEAAAIMNALECTALDALFEISMDDAGAEAEVGEDRYASWDSPCDAAPDGKHDWHKDFTASNSVYMEFKCAACGRRTHLIW